MRWESIVEARKEARRFLRRVRELERRAKDDPCILDAMERGCGCAESAAVRRASMDLSRALSKMRRGE